MLKKMKNWLGIEGVKLELALPQEIRAEVRELHGLVRLSSLHAQTVTRIRVRLVERYQRGRGEEQLTDEYTLGQIDLDRPVAVPAAGSVDVPFVLPYVRAQSGADRLADKNILFGGLAKLAKWASQVKSDYRVEAEAEVVGTALNPFDQQPIILRGS